MMTEGPRGLVRGALLGEGSGASRTGTRTGKSGGNMKVVRHDPVREKKERLLLVILFLILGFGAYWAGGHKENSQNDELKKRNVQLKNREAALLVQKEELAERVAILERASQVDRQAVNNVRTLVRDLEIEKAAIKKDLTFYKSIIAPEDLTEGVRLSAFDLVPGAGPRQYRMRLIISQVARSNPFLRGTLSVNVTGEQQGKPVMLSMLELAGQGKTPALGFRYFQSFPETRDFLDFELPEDFRPESVRIFIRVRSGGAKSLEKSFDWAEELAADVGQEQTGE